MLPRFQAIPLTLVTRLWLINLLCGNYQNTAVGRYDFNRLQAFRLISIHSIGGEKTGQRWKARKISAKREKKCEREKNEKKHTRKKRCVLKKLSGLNNESSAFKAYMQPSEHYRLEIDFSASHFPYWNGRRHTCLLFALCVHIAKMAAVENVLCHSTRYEEVEDDFSPFFSHCLHWLSLHFGLFALSISNNDNVMLCT